MAAQNTNKSEKINYLFEIYNRQHYFVERHDAMAEKFLNVLLIEVTCISIIYTLICSNTNSFNLNKFQCGSIVLFVLVFLITLIHLLLIVQPLSSKAKKANNEELLNTENKHWIPKSLIYYQGIINRISEAQANELAPSEEYYNAVNTDELAKDLVQQIFILAQYSKYKKKKLKISIWLIAATAVIGLVSMAICLF